MKKERQDKDAIEDDFDLDEDLFDFDAVRAEDEDDEADLEDIFASFEQAEAALTAAREEAEAAERAQRQAEAPEVLEAPEPLAEERAPERAEPHRAERSPAAAPHAPAAAPAFGGAGLRVALWVLIAATSVNGLVALVALRSTGELRRSVVEIGEDVLRTADGLVRSVAEGQQQEAPRTPLVPPQPESHPTFELAREEIQRGEYASARQRLYSLLAIVDRLDPLEREDVEARANYLIARALHLESVERWEARR